MSQIKAASPFAPKLEFVNSSAHKDCSCQSEFSFDIKPNICVYKDESNRWGPTDIACAELAIDFKWATNDDPFGPPTLTGEGKNKACSFLHDSKPGVDTAGQITSYAAAQLGSQFHVCVYFILIVQSYNYLAEFLRRYFKAMPKLCGVDTTVGVPTIDEELAVRKCLQVDKKAILMMVAVPTPTSQWRYVICAPKGGPYTPPGCAMHGFVAFDIERGRKVFVKDMWHVDLPGIEQEGETYKLLWDAQVRNIEDHATLTHLYEGKPWACKTGSVLIPHRHYWLVLDTVGESMTKFPSSYHTFQ
ncbi:hypothetical protein PILCRDRAFT_9122 [Piloderma croceum F 1598]|uniref:Fungal-type protein kinase domain-containing protein n=1 Tax=Piloderma croceum (strain F 1598) TaxID=765440 RepID=A0A0C3FPJ4_PILCF|nr:hypothetical protein PILCRDRAFT_9122 [Piloderma croceum F 1598]